MMLISIRAVSYDSINWRMFFMRRRRICDQRQPTTAGATNEIGLTKKPPRIAGGLDFHNICNLAFLNGNYVGFISTPISVAINFSRSTFISI